jgi:hypothetical protein
MMLDPLQWWLLIGGVIFGAWGALLVFNKKFFDSVENSYWKSSDLDRRLFPGKSARIFDRWGRGLGALILGFAMLAIFAATIWQPLFAIISVAFVPSQLFDTLYGRLIMAVLLLIAGYELLRNASRSKSDNEKE